MESSDDEKDGKSTGNGPMPTSANALTRKNKLEVPEGKYFLVDFKYANIPGTVSNTDVKLVVAACALHNYIRDETPDDIIFKMFEHENCVSQLEESVIQPLDFEKPSMMMHADNQMMDVDFPFDAQQIEESSQLRDTIAAEIWNDYVHDFPITEV
ncbi:hypothetical protein L1987_67284 [Smallanthus sonchifolius]|uniref:Uncharacterized protein n=1 Tax=Smallanthus sonchifolius TaxID=185202 RepID=A0ACB9B250_9ASTR|nr:hypothetical protein L1987_67284 [Smallanthus sonchifolius]